MVEVEEVQWVLVALILLTEQITHIKGLELWVYMVLLAAEADLTVLVLVVVGMAALLTIQRPQPQPQTQEVAAAEVLTIKPLTVLLAAQVALAFAACGGLNKENNDELCTYQ
jgi:hypothetical protein